MSVAGIMQLKQELDAAMANPQKRKAFTERCNRIAEGYAQITGAHRMRPQQEPKCSKS